MNYKDVPQKDRALVNQNYRTLDGKPTMFLPEDRQRLQREDHVMLFDMLNDPWETRNLAAEANCRDILAEHEAVLAATESRLIPGHEFTRN